MNDTPDLFSGYPHIPFVRHSDTSRSAANAIEPAATTLRGKVLEAIRARGSTGATDEWLQAHLHMNPSTERPRRRELQLAGFIEDSKRRYPVASGRMAVIWIARHVGT